MIEVDKRKKYIINYLNGMREEITCRHMMVSESTLIFKDIIYGELKTIKVVNIRAINFDDVKH